MFLQFLEPVFQFLVYAALINFLLIYVSIIINKFKHPKKLVRYTPEISLIIPVFNEAANIENCLLSIKNSDYDQSKIQVIVIDDKSTDSTLEIVKKYNRIFSNLIILEGDHKGKALSLNQGIKKAKNEIMILIDSDITFPPDYLSKVVSPFEDHKISYCLTPLHSSSCSNMIEAFQTVEMAFLSVIRNSFLNLISNPVSYAGSIIAIKKSVVKKAGFYSNDTVCEDIDMGYQLNNMGDKGYFRSDAYAFTTPMPTLKKYNEQRMSWFYGCLQNGVKYIQKPSSNYIGLIYSLFFAFVWYFNGLILFPTLTIIIFLSHAFYVIDFLIYLFSLTTFGYFIRSISENRTLYDITGLALYILLIYSLSKEKRWVNVATIFATLTYIFYIQYQQLVVWMSIFKYGLPKNKAFIKE